MTAIGVVLAVLFFGLAIASVVAIVFQYKYRQYIYSLFGVVVTVLLVVGLLMPSDKKSTVAEGDKTQGTLTPEQNAKVLETLAASYKPESKKEYIASTAKIGGKKSPIYYKDLLKTPDKYVGTRVNILCKVMMIQEKDNTTLLQGWINNRYDDTIVAVYPGSIKVYEGDIVTVYGEGGGTLDGENRMGAGMSWPLIKAKYIVKHASEDEE